MLFNSVNFFLFLFGSLIIYRMLPIKYRWILLLASSISFYCIGGLINVYVPVLITLITYYSGIILGKTVDDRTKKIVLYTGIIVNAGLLIFYKYVNFLISNIVHFYYFLSKDSVQVNDAETGLFIDVVIPLGISFITFQAIGYIVDVYNSETRAEKHIGFFATYIFFFPKVISGPVERTQDFLPQLLKRNKFDYDETIQGLKRIVWGLFKKLVIANRLAVYTDAVFSNSANHSSVTLLFTSVLYTFQLYADFSGYTDIALGSARLFGINLKENFNRPLFALSITEFWRKWHMTLTSWVTDYIFTPIIIKRRYWNKWGVIYGTVVTFVILGIWHGSNWTFVLFGLLHGIIISVEFVTKKKRKKLIKKIPAGLNTILGISYTILFFSFTMIFFRSNNIDEALEIVKKIVLMNELSFYVGTLSAIIYSLAGLSFLILYEMNQEFRFTKIRFFESKHILIQQLSYAFLIVSISLFGVYDGGQFIYFQF